MERKRRKLDPEMLKNAKKVDVGALQIPKEFLDKVSGGSWVESEYNCPRCGAPGLLLDYYGVRPCAEYCDHCGWNCNYEEDYWDEW